MKFSKTIHEIVDQDLYCPLPINIFPNLMGINLCSVDRGTWDKQPDGQLRSINIIFKPDPILPD